MILSTLLAQRITNPAVPAVEQVISSAPDTASGGASVLGLYIALLIQTALILGGLAVLLYMFLGAIGWITAGGDSGKIEKARDRIIQSIVGLAVLASVVAVAAFIGPVFGLDLLNPTFINQLNSSGAGSLRQPSAPGSGGMSGAVPGRTQ
ncbi:hypothetical protein LRY65_00840 [Candidatus Woesebacteria bacterium]|nr:hypothetical protein [Candidatus Woesebacteria bacterium]MCD8526744.1 hypothetical protein [Candidatus Woesebacteria bacterium]MCD8546512.1 hypothetical protein [Candidatus Woesebacteria bacterium]